MPVPDQETNDRMSQILEKAALLFAVKGFEATSMRDIEPDAFSALVRTDLAKWGKVVRDSGAKVE